MVSQYKNNYFSSSTALSLPTTSTSNKKHLPSLENIEPFKIINYEKRSKETSKKLDYSKQKIRFDDRKIQIFQDDHHKTLILQKFYVFQFH